MKNLLILSFLGLMVLPLTSYSTIINVPTGQPTIQAGIDVAIPDDTVLVADGTYTGNGNRDIDFGGKNLVLMSQNGPEVTIIDSEGSESPYHRAFNFHSGETNLSVVSGFTIMNGNTGSGGGIYCENSSPRLESNIITDNVAMFGGGIYCVDSQPLIIDCMIISNSAWAPYNPYGYNEYAGGGGIFLTNSDATISSSEISGNRATADSNRGGFGGGISIGSCNPVIENCLISENWASDIGGGMYIGNADPTIIGCSIVANRSDLGSGITVTASWQHSSFVKLQYSIVAFNDSEGIVCRNDYGTKTMQMTNCDIFGNIGGDYKGCFQLWLNINGNFSLDPLMCDPDNGDFYLGAFSPCLAINNNSDRLIGALGVGCKDNNICGDTNYDGEISIADIVFLIDYYFGNGPPPTSSYLSDINCNLRVGITDIVFLNNLLFKNGTAGCCP